MKVRGSLELELYIAVMCFIHFLKMLRLKVKDPIFTLGFEAESHVAQIGLKLLIFLPPLLSAKMTGVYHLPCFLRFWMESRALCMLDEYSIH